MTMAWKSVIGLSISVALLWWVFRGEDLGAIATEIAAADPWWLLASASVATGGNLVRAMRWKVLLSPLRPHTGLGNRFAATMIGFMANNLLPARAGELVRAWSFARMEKMSVSGCLASLAVERFLDGVIIVTLLVLSLSLPGFPADAAIASQSFEGALAAMVAVLAIFAIAVTVVLWRPGLARAVARPFASRLPGRAGERVLPILDGLIEGLGALRRPSLLIRGMVWSLFFWLWHSASFWLGFRAFGIEAGYAGALFLNGITALAVAIPSAPGFFGPFEAAVRVALVNVLGIGENPALAFAAGYHIAAFIPVTAIGLWYAWRMGFSLREMGAGNGTGHAPRPDGRRELGGA